jgi:hypothetical protein
MTNHFEALAEAQMVAATKAKHRAAEKRAMKVKVVQSEKDAPMKLSELEQKVADQSKQMRIYKRAKREEALIIYQGQPADYAGLDKVLRALTIDNGQTLVDYVTSAAWLREADLRTRQTVLGAIADELIRIRLQNGYAPMDDSLPGEAPTVFEIIRKELRVLTP